MKHLNAEIEREHGDFPGIDHVHGVSFDGQSVWVASGAALHAIDPESGGVRRKIDVAAHAGTAFDGRHLFQIAENCIQKVDPETGRVRATIPAPGGGGDSGLAWAEGRLWVGQYRERKIHQIDPDTGAILRTLESDRFVTGVTWADGELWHGTWEGEESELRRIDSETGEVLGLLEMPPGAGVSGLESEWPGSVLLRRREQREGEDCPQASVRSRGTTRSHRDTPARSPLVSPFCVAVSARSHSPTRKLAALSVRHRLRDPATAGFCSMRRGP